jgi:hypothetical protein
VLRRDNLIIALVGAVFFVGVALMFVGTYA